jgi:hypothetical protein
MNEDVRHEMLHVTLIHELCHIIAYRTTKERGHGTGWKMAMQLMGLPAERVYDNEDGTLPPWTEAMQQVVAEAKERLAAKNYDVNEYIPLEDGEQV